MLLLVTAWFPIDKAGKASKAWTQMPTFPLYVKRLGDYNVIDGQLGSKTYHLMEIESGHTESGFMELRKILNNFSKIEGYKWRLEILSTVKDTMLLFGLGID